MASFCSIASIASIVGLWLVLSFSLSAQIAGENEIPFLQRTPSNSGHSAVLKSNIDLHFFVDTLSLPFIDDFSTDRTKKYQWSPSNSIDTVYHQFFELLSGYPDSLYYKVDTTYSYVYNNTTGVYDTFPNNPITIYWYLDSSDLSLRSDTQYVWPAISYKQFNGSIEEISLVPDFKVYNPDTLLFVLDDNTLWMDRPAGVWINNGFGINPITIGVATFDGLNHSGYPYLFSPSAQGKADQLTSKPIDLALLASDSIVLSFYYQAAGYGNAPDEEDSLVLEFLSMDVLNPGWKTIWSAQGNSLPSNFPNEPVKINISQSQYLQKGFQFRFTGYSTLSGSFDVWNLDYVYLDKNRSMAHEEIQDIAFTHPLQTTIKTFTQMPWNHYKDNPALNTLSDVELKMVNLSSTTNALVNTIDIKDQNNTYVLNGAPLALGSVPTGALSINPSFASAPNSFLYTATSNERESFQVKAYNTIGSSNPVKENDTLVLNQIFDTYYAYDDGKAEAAYFVASQGGAVKGAMKFSINLTDTLRAIYMSLPPVLENNALSNFNLMVWKSIQPEQELYRGLATVPDSLAQNDFYRFELDEPLVLGGEFWIGWEHYTDVTLYVGKDKNTDQKNRIYYSKDNQWFNTSLSGTLMLRPDFGKPEVALSIGFEEKKTELHIYPNPSNGLINIQSETQMAYHITNIQGQLVWQGQLYPGNNSVNLYLPTGIYYFIPTGVKYKAKKMIIHSEY